MHKTTHVDRTRGTLSLAVTIVLGGAFSLILYSYGASWWYAPLAVPGLVLAHMAIFGGIVFIATRFTRWRRVRQRPISSKAVTEDSHESGSMLLRRPRLFDWLMRVHTLGRERKLREWMLNLADLEPGNVVLDVGCGTGTLLLAAAERVGPSGALHGVEPAMEMAAYARHKAEACRVPLEVVEGSAGSLPYPPASFDAIFCSLVLHHLPASMRDVAICEIRRVLRPGGRAIIIDWQRPKSLTRAITGALSLPYLLHSLRPGGSPPNVLDIEPLMRELGFEEITRDAFGSGVLVALIGRLGSGNGAVDQAEAEDSTPIRSDA